MSAASAKPPPIVQQSPDLRPIVPPMRNPPEKRLLKPLPNWQLGLLAPILYLQGKYVRRVALRLPPPPGRAQDQQGSGPPFRLLLAGDSSAAGIGAETFEEGLCGQLVGNLSADYTVAWQLIAKSGASTASTLSAIKRKASGDYDLAVIATGVNDVTSFVPLEDWLDQQRQLIDHLTTQHSAKQIILCGVPEVGMFPLLPHPLKYVLGHQADAYDQARLRLTEAYENVAYLSTRFEGEGLAMANDGFHPGPAVYREWAKGVESKLAR
ncbi:MAG: SGNH/GDSL hydrolase family protein [Pseudomonadota bacterium]